MTFIHRAVLALLVSLFSLAAFAVDLDAIMRDLIIQKTTQTDLKIGFWLPPDFFHAANPGVGEADKKKLTDMLDGHMVFLVLNARFGEKGKISPASRSEVLSSTRLRLNDGKYLTPLADDRLRSDIKMLAEVFKPVLKDMLGAFGEAFELVVFPDPETRISRATSPGQIHLQIADQTLAWRTPLAGLLPPVVDPSTGEQFPGNYVFNPYSGRRLQNE